MNQPTKSNDSATRGSLFKVAIVGAATLKGKELKDVLSERNFPALETKLLDEEDVIGQLDSVGDEPTFIQSVMPEHLSGVDFSFFTGDEAYTMKSWRMARSAGSEIIDLSYALESTPNVSLRAPWLQQELGYGHPVELASSPVIVAHPASVVLALLMVRLQRASNVRQVSATIYEPASENGRAGMDELHDQTVNLLSFQQMPTNVYGTQVAFNMISAYGEGSPLSLLKVQERVLRHFREITDGKAMLPSLLMVQAPVFHGHAFAIHVELNEAVQLDEVAKALEGEHVEITAPSEEPSNVTAAGSAEILVTLRPGSDQLNDFWIWAASDNLRILALQAVECAEDMATTRPRGQVQ